MDSVRSVYFCFPSSRVLLDSWVEWKTVASNRSGFGGGNGPADRQHGRKATELIVFFVFQEYNDLRLTTLGTYRQMISSGGVSEKPFFLQGPNPFKIQIERHPLELISTDRKIPKVASLTTSLGQCDWWWWRIRHQVRTSRIAR